MKARQTKTIGIPYERERVWLYAVVLCCVTSIVLYMYFLSASVVHVVMRKELDGKITEMNSRLSSLETEYIEAQHAVSEDIASLRGFTRTDQKVFIDKGDTTLVLRTVTN